MAAKVGTGRTCRPSTWAPLPERSAGPGSGGAREVVPNLLPGWTRLGPKQARPKSSWGAFFQLTFPSWFKPQTREVSTFHATTPHGTCPSVTGHGQVTTQGGEVGAKENWMKNLEVENFDSLGKALVRQIS